MSKAPHSRERGFVLSEILVAMIVLAIAAIGFLHLVQDSAVGMNTSKGLDAQTSLAHELMQNALNSSEYDSEPFNGTDEKTGLAYTITIKPDTERQSKSAEQPSVSIVTVEVNKSGKNKVSLTSAKWVKHGIRS